MPNKFYIGSPDIAVCFTRGEDHSWTLPTLEAAIERAKNRLRSDLKEKAITIVKIVAIVYKAEPPIEVEIIE